MTWNSSYPAFQTELNILDQDLNKHWMQNKILCIKFEITFRVIIKYTASSKQIVQLCFFESLSTKFVDCGIFKWTREQINATTSINLDKFWILWWAGFLYFKLE